MDKQHRLMGIWILILLVLAITVQAGIFISEEDVRSPQPLINATFFPTEPYGIFIATPPSLCKLANTLSGCNVSVPLSNLNSEDPLAYLYSPLAELEHREPYLFELDFEDKAGNLATSTLQFTVVYDPLRISIATPRNGATREPSTPVVIETDRFAQCRWNQNKGFEFGYNHSSAFDSVSSDGKSHTIDDFTVETVQSLFVFCKDDARGEVPAVEFVVYLDNDPPYLVNLQTNYPNNIITDGFVPTEAFLHAESNEPTRCKYGQAQGETMPSFEDMLSFPGFENEEFSLFHTARIFPDFPEPYEPVTFGVICEDQAGRLSTDDGITSTLTIGLDLSAPLQFIGVDTPSYISSSSTTLSVRLNKRTALCFAYLDQDLENSIGIMSNTQTISGIPSLQYNQSVSGLSIGEHTFYAKCFENAQTADYIVQPISFTVDQEAPEMISAEITSPLGNDSKYIYTTDELEVLLEAKDEDSGIERFFVAVYNASTSNDVLIETLSVRPNDDENNTYIYEGDLDGLDLKDGGKYYITANATDFVGLNSLTKESDLITVDTDLTPVSCSNRRLDGDESDVDCGGSCSRTCGLGKNCSTSDDCSSKFCKDGTCTSSSCNDNVWNGDETDEDCGGSCDECGIGEDCKNDNDCASRHCDASTRTCKERLSHCQNTVFDPPFETDLNCGGLCDKKCDTGQFCESNTDCKSKVCHGGTCAKPECDDGVKNQDESDVDCGGSCQTSCGIGQKCLLDLDCTTDNCVAGFCTESDDRDNDGIPNSWEINNGLNPDDPSDAGIDIDVDGLSNKQEFDYGTNPRNEDTDGDGASDGDEVAKGTNPLDPNDKPGSKLWIWLLFLIILLVVLAIGFLLFVHYQQLEEQKKKKPQPMPYQTRRSAPLPQGGMRRPIIPPPQLRPTRVPEQPKKEWLSLNELAGGKKAGDVFNKLSTLADQPKRAHKDIFGDLDKIAGSDIERSHIQKIAQSEKTPKEDLLKTFHKLAEKEMHKNVVGEISKTLEDLEKSHKHLTDQIKDVNDKLNEPEIAPLVVASSPPKKTVKKKKKATKKTTKKKTNVTITTTSASKTKKTAGKKKKKATKKKNTTSVSGNGKTIVEIEGENVNVKVKK